MRITAATALKTFLVVGAVLVMGGSCLDMFDPAGGSYARGRFVDPEAFTLQETRTNRDDVTYTLKATKPEGRIKLRSVYLFSYLAPERRNGPSLKYEMTSDFQLSFTVKKDEIARFSGVAVFGDYQSPELAITGARSVNILQEIYFAK